MEFKKDVLFLGMQPNTLSDGKTYYTVSLFVPDIQATVQVNVMETSKALVEALMACQFGDPLNATFALRPKDKLYRLALVSV